MELPLESRCHAFMENSLSEIERLTVKEQVDCEICFKTKEFKTKLLCEHSFCNECITEWVKRMKNSCPMCRTPITKI